MTMTSVRADLAYTREMQGAAVAHGIRALQSVIKLHPCETCDKIETCDGTGCNKRDSRA